MPARSPIRCGRAAISEINNFYTATVYEKGAEIIRMLKTLIGDAAFEAGMDLYFERCDGTAATVEDFLACFAEVTGRDLSQFARWYEQAGTPSVVARAVTTRGASTYRARLRPDDAADAGPAGEAAGRASRSRSASSAGRRALTAGGLAGQRSAATASSCSTEPPTA